MNIPATLMRRASRAVLVTALALEACTETGPAGGPRGVPSVTRAVETPRSFAEKVVASAPLSESRVVLISKNDYLQIEAAQSWQSASPELRGEAASVAAKLTDASALGVFGQIESGAFETELLAVAADLRESELGVEASDLVIVAMKISWSAPHVKAPLLALTKELKSLDCSPLLRGCHPIFETGDTPQVLATEEVGASGLPRATIINAETEFHGVNAWGFTPQLWFPHDPEAKLDAPPNRYVCYGEIAVASSCDAVTPGESGVQAAPYQEPLPEFTLISEQDFNRLIEERAYAELSKDDLMKTVVPLATLANSTSVIGLVGTPEGTEIHGLVVVARDLVLTSQGNLEATSFYFPNVLVDGTVSTAGRNVNFGMTDLMNVTLTGPCGAITLTTPDPRECLVCLSPEIVEFTNPSYGTNVYPRPRTTVHLYAFTGRGAATGLSDG